MKKKLNYFLFFFLLCIPLVVFAESEDAIMMWFMEAFVTIHMTIFVHVPLAHLLTQGDTDKKRFKIVLGFLIGLRIFILILGNMKFGMGMAMFDFFMVFVGAFILIPASIYIEMSKRKSILASVSKDLGGNVMNNEVSNKARQCPNCHQFSDIRNTFCVYCGTKMVDDANVSSNCPYCNARLNPGVLYCVQCGKEIPNGPIPITENVTASNVPEQRTQYTKVTYDPIFNKSEALIISDIINEELRNNNFDSKNMVIPAFRRRQLIFGLLFAIVTFLCVCLVFFHLPFLYYCVYFIFLFIYLYNVKKYDVKAYILKQVKSRPDEKISNVVSSIVATAQRNRNSYFEYIAMFLVAILLPCIIFAKPRIFYEKMDEGYGVRFYAFGLTNFTTVEIPEEVNGEKVISIRGNGFSNMPFLREAKLPDTIKEIRGQAFKNDYSLKKVNMPRDLEYLGGGSFYDCISLTEIEFYDKVTFIGGETFKNAKNLKSVNIPSKITEIRGSTFENCSSLESINIPDGVTRIGGHAFYGNSSLKTVEISENSQLAEIGSSAFRACDSLEKITIPKKAVVNERAFKESPTIVYYYSSIPGIDSSFKNVWEYINMSYGATIRDENYQTLFTMSLEKVEATAYGYTYTIKVEGKYNTTFTLTENDEYKKINDSLYVEVRNLYTDSVSLDIYYK